MSIRDGIVGAMVVGGGSGSGGGGSVVVPNINATAESLPAGSEATVEKSGSSTNVTFNFGIPRGADGQQGAPGATGPAGPQGAQGQQGPAGPTGQQGPRGEQGPTGAQGPEGPQGPQGVQGEKGDQGTPFLISKIYANTTEMNEGYATDGLQKGQLVAIATDTGGEQGGYIYAKGPTQYDFFYDISTTDGIQGPQGPQGEQGPQGPAGPAGATGATGPAGPQGEQGPQGEKGAPGEQGPEGPTGQAATIQVGTVTTGEPGTNAQVTNSGTSSEAVFDFVIPRGRDGGGGGGDYTAGNGIEIQKSTISLKVSSDSRNTLGFGADGGLLNLANDFATPLTFVLAAWSWGGDEAPFSQTVPAEGITEDNYAVTGPATGADSANAVAAGVRWSAQGNGTLTYTAQQKPTVDLTYSGLIFDTTPPPAPRLIYGAEWDGTSTSAWIRTDSAIGFKAPDPAVNNGTGSSPFDNIMPWSGMQIVEDETAGTLVSIPKYYYKWTRTGAAMKLQISMTQFDGFLVSPAHADRGDGQGERDVVYVGRYHCASTYKSTTGVQPLANITRATARTNISALGADIWQYDFAMWWTINMLYLVEYANWNSQATIGYGCSPDRNKFNMGLTDSMQYHTGTSAANRTTYGCCQYRHIEGLWDNVFDWCDGIYFSGTNVYCIKAPGGFSDTTGGTQVGMRSTASNGYTSAWTSPTADGFEYALYPSAVEGSRTTFVCDYCNYNASGAVLSVGGNYNISKGNGTFFLNGTYTASNHSASIGCRLQKLPNT